MDDQTKTQERESQPLAKRLGHHIKTLRAARGDTQESLAERSGLAADTIGRLEQGLFSPSLNTLRKLCGGLDLLLSSFFEGLENGERDRSRELLEAFEFLTPEEEQALIKLLLSLRGRVCGGD